MQIRPLGCGEAITCVPIQKCLDANDGARNRGLPTSTVSTFRTLANQINVQL